MDIPETHADIMRDYRDLGLQSPLLQRISISSVQVMLFADRLEVWNPGESPPALTIPDLRKSHASISHNPLIAEPMLLSTYAEKAGSGIIEMYGLCREAKLPPPAFRQDGRHFVQTIWRPKAPSIKQPTQENLWGQPESRPESLDCRMLRLLSGHTQGKRELSAFLSQKEVSVRLNKVIRALLAKQAIAPTIPDNPQSRLHKHQLTAKVKKILEARNP